MPWLEILFFGVALVLYSIAIGKHIFSKNEKIKNSTLLVFGIALTCDVTGTIAICAPARDAWIWNFHTVTGLLSVVIMALHFAWALIASSKRGKAEYLFKKYAASAWILWVLSFVSGIPA